MNSVYSPLRDSSPSARVYSPPMQGKMSRVCSPTRTTCTKCRQSVGLPTLVEVVRRTTSTRLLQSLLHRCRRDYSNLVEVVLRTTSTRVGSPTDYLHFVQVVLVGLHTLDIFPCMGGLYTRADGLLSLSGLQTLFIVHVVLVYIYYYSYIQAQKQTSKYLYCSKPNLAAPPRSVVVEQQAHECKGCWFKSQSW